MPPAFPAVRAMRAEDLPRVLAIQLACYGEGFVEDGALIERRLRTAPSTAWVADTGAGALAYLTAYPSRLGRLTALHGEFEPAADADTLYLHDLAVHPEGAGRGLGPMLVHHALAAASTAGWTRQALVSVQSSLGFWQRFGFGVQALEDAARAQLRSYPGEAHYMVRMK